MAKRRTFVQPPESPETAANRMRDLEAVLLPRRIALQDIPVDRIRPNPFQARRSFDGIEELAESIRQQGFITRLRLRPAPGEDTYFELVYGERRLQAARLAGLAMVPCEIAYHSDDELIEIGLVENVQRQDLDPLEEAEAFRRFLDHKGYTIARLAERIGKTENYIKARLALLRVPTDVREMVKRRPDTIRAARDIARLPTPEERQPFIEKVLKNDLNAQEVRRQTAEEIRRQEEERARKLAIDSARFQERASAARERVSAATIDFYYSQIETDARTLQLVIQRWRTLAADPKARRALLNPVDELVTQIEKLAEALQD